MPGDPFRAIFRRPARLRRLAGEAAVLAAAAAAGHAAAFLLRFNGDVPPPMWAFFSRSVVLAVVVRLAVGVWRDHRLSFTKYFSFRDLVRLVQAVTLGSLGLALADALLMPQASLPRSVLLMDWGATLVLLGGLYSFPRLVSDSAWRSHATEQLTPALIVGADDAGEGLLRAVLRNPRLNYDPVGFLDDRSDRHGQRIAGTPVLGGLADLPALVSRYGVQQVLITSGALPGRQVRKLMGIAPRQGCRVRVLPSYEQLLREDVKVKPRDVAIADLLRRPPVELTNARVLDWVRGRVVMVTGSCGSIGSELAAQLLPLGPRKLVLLDRSETGQFFLERQLAGSSPGVDREVVLADLNDRPRMGAVFSAQQPDLIFHAAAYKHVPLMESHPGEAVKNIVLATRNLVDLAEERGAEGLVMISTDKAVNPTSVMGACKRLAEQYVQSKAVGSPCRMETVRFGNVLDSAGSVVPIFRQQIAEGGPVTITHPEMVRYFMLIPEAAQLVIQAGAMGQGGEVFVLDMGDPVRLMDLARDMIRLSGLREGEDIEIKVTGLRPGEKLYEELYDERERHKPTAHEKIMVATSTPRNLLQVLADIRRLAAASNGPAERVRDVLREIVPLHDKLGRRRRRGAKQAA